MPQRNLHIVKQILRKYWWVLAGLLFMVIWVGLGVNNLKSEPLREVEIIIGENKATFTAEVVASPALRAKGLSGRVSLPLDRGMLFIFDEASRYAFWMPEMKFPIDIIWIEDGVIADITTNVPTEPVDRPLPTYTPKVPISRVLEVNAGLVAKYNLQIGDRVLVK